MRYVYHLDTVPQGTTGIRGADAAALHAQQVTSLLRPLARAKRSRLLQKTLRSLEALGLRSNVVHRNLLLSALERLSHWQQAIDNLRDLRDENLEATAATMSTVSSSCAKASEWQKALEVFGDTRFKDTICFNVAISACARGDRWITAVRLLREMRATEVQADAISYNSAISACQWLMALALLAEMKEVDLQADVVSYGAVLASNIEWDAACQLLQGFSEGIQLDDLNHLSHE
ncbi:unnamed protein product [Cladocopium goreaui]|uniref:Pentatricopeptide repeat-containing protein GUN1, chloroplastic (Pentatricopeptide repeat-containing protein At2g31400) (Protein GENOMES UNCOUPLED 1) n=1 Tax=Cladocopium goreaui TaxID=2562237 RepID=A0A9P1FED4_9DINO|nr:unnamed protein product [Cladocopium goreaui]